VELWHFPKHVEVITAVSAFTENYTDAWLCGRSIEELLAAMMNTSHGP